MKVKQKVYNNFLILTKLLSTCNSKCFFVELGATKDISFEMYNTRDPDEEKVKHYRSTVHPLGTVPALVIEGREEALIESGAICVYLAELYQKLQPKQKNKADYFK